MLIAMATPTTGQHSSDLIFGSATFDGSQTWDGALLGLRLHPEWDPAPASLTAFSKNLHLVVVNRTAPTVAQIGLMPANGGYERDYQSVSLTGADLGGDVDVLVVPVAGAPLPRILGISTHQESQRSRQEQLTETPYANVSRPLLSSNVGNTIASSSSITTVRIEGTFAVSFWSWNLTIGRDSVATGSARTNIQRDPVTGRELFADTVEQVAQLTFADGYMEILAETRLTTYVDAINVTGEGSAILSGVTGLLGDGRTAVDAQLQIDGNFELTQAHTDGVTYTRFTKTNGHSPRDIPPEFCGSEPDPEAPVPDVRPERIFGPAMAGVFLAAELVKSGLGHAIINNTLRWDVAYPLTADHHRKIKPLADCPNCTDPDLAEHITKRTASIQGT
jgi:hypothetical protein